MSESRGVTAGRAVVDVLRMEGVRSVFGIPDGHVIGIYDALYRDPIGRDGVVQR